VYLKIYYFVLNVLTDVAKDKLLAEGFKPNRLLSVFATNNFLFFTNDPSFKKSKSGYPYNWSYIV